MRGVSPRSDGKAGSVFWFAIPYRPDPLFVSDQREPEGPGQGPGPPDQERGRGLSVVTPDNTPSPARSLRVLLVDDTLSILKVVGRALLSKKYIVETAENGFIALNMLIDGYAEGHYDVVLMDFQMPVMDGIETVSRYRGFENNQSSPSPLPLHSPDNRGSTVLYAEVPRCRLLIIGMSANSDNAIVKGALDAGMDAFLPKPFTMSELQTLMEAKQASSLSSSSSSSTSSPPCGRARSPVR